MSSTDRPGLRSSCPSTPVGPVGDDTGPWVPALGIDLIPELWSGARSPASPTGRRRCEGRQSMNDAGSPVERVVTLPGQGRTVVWDCPGPPGAPTLMLVHGATMTAELNWSAVFPVLCQQFRVLAFDQRGHGQGLGCAGAYRLEQCADDIAGLAAVLGVERLIMVGYSMGGLIAQLCWRRHPQLTAGLVLCATARSIAGVQWARWATLMMPGLMMPAVMAGAGSMPWMAGLRADLIGTHLLDRPRDRADRAWALGQMRRTPLLTAVSAVSAVYAFSSHDWIGGMNVPTAVIITRHDRVVSPARQRGLAAAVPGALVYDIDGEHDVFLTAPGRFAAALRAACQDICSVRSHRPRTGRPAAGLHCRSEPGR
ncbi:MAG: alpha/beta hydrolase [Pseudonocardiaceae bacterium]